MAAVELGQICGECEICAAAPEQRVQPDDAVDPARRDRSRRRGRRRRTPCVRCGHPIRLHLGAEGRDPVVGALLPDDLPPISTSSTPATPLAPAVVVAPDVEPRPTPDEPSREATAPAGDSLVDQIRTLTELYKAGLLDDDEFAAAKAVVLRDPGT